MYVFSAESRALISSICCWPSACCIASSNFWVRSWDSFILSISTKRASVVFLRVLDILFRIWLMASLSIILTASGSLFTTLSTIVGNLFVQNWSIFLEDSLFPFINPAMSSCDSSGKTSGCFVDCFINFCSSVVNWSFITILKFPHGLLPPPKISCNLPYKSLSLSLNGFNTSS